ncbi:hypothetical protein ACFXPQ_03530 [Streptomyces lydicus]
MRKPTGLRVAVVAALLGLVAAVAGNGAPRTAVHRFEVRASG